MVNEIAEEDHQESVTIAKDEIPHAASSEDDEIESGYCFDNFLKNDLIKLHESSSDYSIIRKGFFSGMGETLSKSIKIVAIHKTSYSGFSAKAQAENFQILKKAVAEKCGGDANVKYAWYGGSRDEICEILTQGFSWYTRTTENQNRYRNSVCFSAAKFSFGSVLSSKVDETGLNHLLLCRVILGKAEVVTAGDCNGRFHPSSPEFDSGVDNLSDPRRYIIWSTYMNSHILPGFIISFEAPFLRDGGTIKTRSPWLRFTTLLSMLSRRLSPSEMASLEKHYKDFQEKKITKPQLIERIKEIAGRQLSPTIFSPYTNKKLQGCSGGK
ncbi:similar to RCD one 2 [Hibiscus trionum]|uniref:Similar to RCD one 2 n=1 Tax=Hibiscus trionum TaxID=183268 RepID=A0A9W7I398_HIBTR|nr:similar to RCD one 2 [Hibiscus trionum]